MIGIIIWLLLIFIIACCACPGFMAALVGSLLVGGVFAALLHIIPELWRCRRDRK